MSSLEKNSSYLVGLGLIAAGLVVFLGPLLGGTSSRAAGVAGHDFVGARTCRACHAEAFEKWSNGPHAKAMARLGALERKDPRCLQCHTMSTDDPDPLLEAVQCESCHGPGRYYARENVMRDAELRAQLMFVVPDEKTCVRCHTPTTPAISPFQYSAALERIRHWPLPADTRSETAPKIDSARK